MNINISKLDSKEVLMKFLEDNNLRFEIDAISDAIAWVEGFWNADWYSWEHTNCDRTMYGCILQIEDNAVKDSKVLFKNNELLQTSLKPNQFNATKRVI